MSERKSMGGTDGFREEYTQLLGPGLMNYETVGGLTVALLNLPEISQESPVVLARDTRPSGEELLDAAVAGAIYCRGNVINLNVAPTPVAQKIGEILGGASATVVITASHNPEKDNGWKGMIRSSKPNENQVQAIDKNYWQLVDSGLVIPRGAQVKPQPELIDLYVDRVINNIEHEFGTNVLGGKLFVYDGANGAAANITPTILRRLGADVIEFEPASKRINDGCGAGDLSGLKEYLQSRPDIINNPNFVGAIANDGDADRMMAYGVKRYTSGNELVEINGNHTMWAIAQGEPGIVGTLYTNSGLRTKLREQGIGFEECANGDVYVTQKLRELQQQGKPWTKGGEFTGHTVNLGWLSSGDGLYSAAWLAASVVSKGMTFGDLHDDVPLWYEKITKVKLASNIGKQVVEHDIVQLTIEQAEDMLGDGGRFIVRKSGTEPVVRVWGESADSQSSVEALVGAIEESVRIAAEEIGAQAAA